MLLGYRLGEKALPFNCPLQGWDKKEKCFFGQQLADNSIDIANQLDGPTGLSATGRESKACGIPTTSSILVHPELAVHNRNDEESDHSH